jgi:hypothetical protein
MTVSNFTPYYVTESPYSLTPIVSDYMTYYVHRSVNPHPFDRLYVINEERYIRRPDLLADDFYGDRDLWWVIPVRNGLEDPIFDLTRNKRIYIPDPTYVRTII